MVKRKKRKLIITLVGIAAGVVVVGATLGGLAGAGIFNPATNNTTPDNTTPTENTKEEKTEITALKSLAYKAFSEELGQTNDLSRFAKLSNEKQDEALVKLKTELKSKNLDGADKLAKIIENLKNKNLDSIKKDLIEMWIKYGQNIQTVNELGTKALKDIKTFMGSAHPGKDGSILKALNIKELRWFYNDLQSGLQDKSGTKPINDLLSSSIDNIITEINNIKKKIGVEQFKMKYDPIVKDIALGNNKEKINEISEKYNQVLIKIAKVKIYQTFWGLVENKTGIKSADEIKNIDVSAIDIEIEKIKPRLDASSKMSLDKIYKNVKDATPLTVEKLTEIQNELAGITKQLNIKLFTKVSRWQIYDIFTKAHLKADFNRKSKDAFEKLTITEQYSELDKLKSAISENGQNYSTMAEKVLNKVIGTIKAIDDRATELSSEQKKLIQGSIDTNIKNFLVKMITKLVREEAYSYIINNGHITGLESLNDFKGLDSVKQFETLKNVKDKIGTDDPDNIRKEKQDGYFKTITFLESEENDLVKDLNDNTLRKYLNGIFEITKWVNQFSNLLQAKITIYQSYWNSVQDKTGIKSADEIKSIPASAIDSEINKLKSKLDGWHKLWFGKVYTDVQNKASLTNEELTKFKDKLKTETTENFKNQLLTKSRWQIYEIFKTAPVKAGYKKIQKDAFEKLTIDNQYGELNSLKSAISENGQNYAVITAGALAEAINTIKNIEIATSLSSEQKNLIQAAIDSRRAENLLTNVITKKVRERLYSFLISRRLTSGLASLDTFKGFDRDNQFKELDKVKNKINDNTKKDDYSNYLTIFQTNEGKLDNVNFITYLIYIANFVDLVKGL